MRIDTGKGVAQVGFVASYRRVFGTDLLIFYKRLHYGQMFGKI